MISHQQQQQQRAAYDAAIADVNVAAELVANAERALERAIAGKLSPRFVERRERELADARQLLAETRAAVPPQPAPQPAGEPILVTVQGVEINLRGMSRKHSRADMRLMSFREWLDAMNVLTAACCAELERL